MSNRIKQREVSETAVTLSEALYEDRRESFIRVLGAIIDRITSDSTIARSIQLRLPASDIIQHIDKIVKGSLRGEREMFLTYVMFNLIQIGRDTGAKLPKFAVEFKQHYSQADGRYDPDGRLRNLMLVFREKACPNVIKRMNNFVAEYLGFQFDSAKVRSMLVKLRTLVYKFVTEMTAFIHETRNVCVQMATQTTFDHAKTQLITGKNENRAAINKKMKLLRRCVRRLRRHIEHESEAEKIVDVLENIVQAELERIMVDEDDGEGDAVKNLELGRDVEALRRENEHLKRTVTLLQDQMMKGNADFGNLYSSLEGLQEQIRTSAANLEAKQAALGPDDAGAVVMKAHLLFEEITLAKMQVAEKDFTVTALQREIIATKRKLSYQVEAERVCKEKYKLLKDRLRGMAKEKAGLEETVDHLTEAVTRASAKAKAKRSVVVSNDAKLVEQEEQIMKLTTSLSRMKMMNEQLTDQSEEYRESLGSLSAQLDVMTASESRAQDELTSLRELVEVHRNCRDERDAFELSVHQLSRENDSTTMRAELVRDEVERLKELNTRLTEDVRQSQKAVATAQREAEAAAFEVKKERVALEDERHRVRIESERMIFEMTRSKEAKLKADASREAMKREMEDQNERIANQLRTMSESGKKRVQAAENAHELQKKEVLQRLEICEANLREAHEKQISLHAENAKLKAMANENEETFRLLKADLKRLLPQISDDSLVDGVRALHSDMKATEAVINTAICTLRELRETHKSLFEPETKEDLVHMLLEFIAVFSSMRDGIDGANRDKSALEARVTSVLEQIDIKKLGDIPGAFEAIRAQLVRKTEDAEQKSAECKKAMERHARVMTEISGVVGFSMEDNIISGIADMKSRFEKLKTEHASIQTSYVSLMNSVRAYIPFKDSSEIADAIKKLKDDMRAETRNVKRLHEELSRVNDENKVAQSKLRAVEKAVPGVDFEKLPGLFGDLKADTARQSGELQAATRQHEHFVKRICNAVGDSQDLDDDALVEAVVKIRTEAKKTHVELTALQIQWDDIVPPLHRLADFEEPVDFPAVFRTVISDRDKLKQRLIVLEAEHQETTDAVQQVVDTVSKVIKVRGIDDIPMVVRDIHAASEANKEKVKIAQLAVNTLTGKMAQILGTSSEKDDLVSTVTRMKSEFTELAKRFEVLAFQNNRLINDLRDVVPFSSEGEIIEQIALLKSSEADASARLSAIEEGTKRVLGDNTVEDIPTIVRRLKHELEDVTCGQMKSEKRFDDFLADVNEALALEIVIVRTEKPEELAVSMISRLREERVRCERQVADLQTRFDDVKGGLQELVEFDRECDIVSAVGDMKNQLEQREAEVVGLAKEVSTAKDQLIVFKKSILDVVPARRLDDLPQLLNEMKGTMGKQTAELIELGERHNDLVNHLQRVLQLESSDEGALFDATTRLVTDQKQKLVSAEKQKDKYSDLLARAHDLIEFDADEDLLDKISARNAEIDGLSRHIEELKRRFAERDAFEKSLKQQLGDVLTFVDLSEAPKAADNMKSELVSIRAEMERLRTDHAQLIVRSTQSLGVKCDEKEIPNTIMEIRRDFEKMKSEQDQSSRKFTSIFDALRSIVSFSGEEEIVDICRTLKAGKDTMEDANVKLYNDLTHLRASIDESRAVMGIKNSDDFVKHVRSIVEMNEIWVTESKTLNTALNTMRTSLKRLQGSHSDMKYRCDILDKIAAAMRTVITVDDEAFLPKIVVSIVEENRKMKDHPLEAVVSDVARLMNVVEVSDVVASVLSMKTEVTELRKGKADHSSLLAEIHGIYTISDDRLIPQVLHNAKDHADQVAGELAEASEFIAKLLMNVRGNSALQTITFPLTKYSAAAILQRFREYIVSSQYAMHQYEEFTKTAHEEGYVGNDIYEAHAFLTSLELKKHEHEIMSGTESQLAVMRSDKELLEVRIKEFSEQTKELHDEKSDLRKKLKSRIQGLKEEVSASLSAINDATDVRGELVNLAVGDAFDKDTLLRLLPSPEVNRLKAQHKI